MHTLLSKVREMTMLQCDQISGDVEGAFGYPRAGEQSNGPISPASSDGVFRHAQSVGSG
jgi:hypothetical protein